MKTILTLVFALIAVSLVNANGIEPHSPVGMSVLKNGPLVKLFYRGEQTGKVKVTIYNENGRIIFTEVMKDTDNFMRPYNFSALPAGNYTIELVDEQGKRVKEVTHAREKQEEQGRIAVLTRLAEGEDKYMLAVPNEGRDAFTVRIYNNYNKLVYSKTHIVEGDFATVYNLSKLGGDHTFEVADQQGNVVTLKK